MPEQLKQYGVTPPITISPPTEKEVERNQALIEELKKQHSFESSEESQKRLVVLNTLQQLTEKFVKKVCVSKGMPEHIVNKSGGKIFTFGSYRLGVYGPGSDIDTLLVAPAHITRHDFFTILPPMLQELNPPPENLSMVPDAYVPIIGFELHGISIDLIFARLPNLSSVPKDMILSDKELLRGCDEINLRCLNGCRVTDEILALVPKTGVFKMALRAIKLWAKQRAMYGNVIGFPGGVAWAMLVARICQLYPMAVSSVIISKFFKIMGSWAWPQPVLLKGIEDGPLSVKVWNPKIYTSDRNHLMPIITPAYPSMCATHNITKSTKCVLIREMERAQEIVNKIMVGTYTWDKLFERHGFFTNGYRYYLSVVAAAKGKDQQLNWSGHVLSKLRRLVEKLEQIETIKLAHPFNKGFDKVHYCETEEEAIRIAGGEIRNVGTQDGVKSVETNLNDPNAESELKEEDDSKIKVYTATYYIGLEINTEVSKQIDISWASQEFFDFCKNSNIYDSEQHSIHIHLTRSHELPDDVFEKGDVRPVKQTRKKVIKKKAVATTNGATAGKKRTADEISTGPDMKRHQTDPIQHQQTAVQA